MSSSSLAAATTAKLDVFNIRSYVDFIAELKFGTTGILQMFPHFVGVAIKQNILANETIALLAGTKDQNWVQPPKGMTTKEITIGEFVRSAGEPPKSPKSINELRKSIDDYNEKAYKFMEWVNSCMTGATALRASRCAAIQSCLVSLDIIRFLHEIRIFIAKGTSSNTGESRAYWEGLITQPEKLSSADPEIFARHVANFVTTVQCAEAAGSDIDEDAILTGYLGSLGSEFDAIKTVIIAGANKNLDHAMAQVERTFDNIIAKQARIEGGKLKEINKSDSFRVHMVNASNIDKKTKCKFYMSSGGMCRYGDKCRFQHPSLMHLKRDRDYDDNITSRSGWNDKDKDRDKASDRDRNRRRDRADRGRDKDYDRSDRDRDSHRHKRSKTSERKSSLKDYDEDYTSTDEDRKKSNKTISSSKRSTRYDH